ncbi:MAG: hydrolase [Flavobacterium sp.]|nr:MAG: hydrolase [Flavobacterium sp.]
MTKISYAAIIFLLLTSYGFGQRKILFTNRVKEKITIDGQLNEDVWASTEAATDFVMFNPDNGKPIADSKKTDVKVLYDDDAIYIGAVMHDDEPSKIMREMTQRDNFGSADHFGVFINGNNDGQQDFQFFLSAAGVQMDCVTTQAYGEDYSWDAIWEGAVKITDSGWIAEMRIPYAALRFPKSDKQTWGLNFYRELRRDRQQYTWNPIDTHVSGTINQTGILQGIENIKPPTRLFFFPYSSYYFEADKDDTKNTLKGGLDIKYGISDAFTLDAILIPDFGQTKFDNVELNLGPFEQQFNENRPFFTEGTDLFNKGDLLYSRRIGGAPSTYITSDDPNIVIDNPTTVDLINAVKISGRTKSGLGIGILNAVTKNTYADVYDTQTHEHSEVLVEPLANYSVLVFDQRFNNNSSVSLVNTNVTRNGDFRDANVSAMVYDLNTKGNTYNLSGDLKYSYINSYKNFDDKKGVSTYISMGDTNGNYRYDFGGVYVSKDYDNNDLGINFQTHYHSFFLNTSYRILNPTKRFNTFQININPYLEFDNATGRRQQANFNGNVNWFTKKNNYYNVSLNTRVAEIFDFYEPRIDGRYVYLPPAYGGGLYYSTNNNKRFGVDLNPSFSLTPEKHREAFYIFFSPRYRFTNRINASVGFTYQRQNNNVGYIDDTFTDANSAYDIYFAKRNRSTYTATLGSKYSITKDMTINLNARYYWSYADNREFFTLDGDGHLTPAIYTENKNSNFNTWNMDLSYSWWFAPGSQISVLYRNSANTFDRDLGRDFNYNFSNTFKENLSHIFSISIRYFIDYNRAKNWF